MNIKANLKSLYKITTAAGLLATSIWTAEAAGPDFMPVTGMTSTPIGHVQFCKANPADCRLTSDRAPLVRLNEATWRELVAVNEYVNKSVTPITDQDLYNVAEYWTYPGQAGDCEDYALQKRKILMERGWPAGSLLITVVMDTDRTGHAVLTVRTDQGDFILDNQDYRVLAWNKTPYRYIKRQSPRNSGLWTQILDERPNIVASRQ